MFSSRRPSPENAATNRNHSPESPATENPFPIPTVEIMMFIAAQLLVAGAISKRIAGARYELVMGAGRSRRRSEDAVQEGGRHDDESQTVDRAEGPAHGCVIRARRQKADGDEGRPRGAGR